LLVDGFARKDWKYFFRLASGAQGWQREDAEQGAGERCRLRASAARGLLGEAWDFTFTPRLGKGGASFKAPAGKAEAEAEAILLRKAEAEAQESHSAGAEAEARENQDGHH